MYLSKIILHDFRNIADASLVFSPKINCITGSNGAGKTNLLDAVYYLSMTKSYFSSSDQYLYRFGTEEAIVSGLYEMDDGTRERVAVSVRRNGKTVTRGGKPYERFSDHIGLLPIVMVSPSDSALINDSGDERRKYMNFILSQTDRNYLRHIQAYTQYLLRRNKLLKDGFPQEVLLDTLTEQMEPHAQYVYEARRQLCTRLLPIAQEFYTKLSGGYDEISIEFRSNMDEMGFYELMERNAEKDRILGYTLAGIQRDEMLFTLDGHPLRKCGSQGQQKSFLLALKLAQMRFMQDVYGLKPILLLDDVFDKLDMARVQNLISIVSSREFGQIFLSDSNKVRISGIVDAFDADCVEFIVDNGVFTPVEVGL
ncbi:MAG: DNA replication and repair protein RecF [Bacteroidales bacterium]|nr:DNA replication and repair protein RecF [Bacteroidales bacterium]